MAVPKLFIIDEGDLIINKIEILTHPAFREILKRDKSRNKAKAFEEFVYIYHIADIKSTPNRSGDNAEDAHKFAVDSSKLPKTYRPDLTVVRAIEYYRREQRSEATETIMEMLRIFKNISTVMKKVRINIDKLLQVSELDYEGATTILNLIKLAIAEGKEIPIITRELKKAIVELEISEGVHDAEKARGTDEVIPKSMLPNSDY